MASRRSTHPSRVRAETERDEVNTPPASAERFLQACAVLQQTLPLEQQVAHVLEATRDAVGVDRLCVWAVAPEADRLIHVASSGLSEPDRLSLSERVEISLAEAGAMATVYRDKLSLIVDEAHPLPRKSRLKPPYSAINALRTKSLVVVPIIARGRVLGLLVADNKYRRTPLVGDRLHLLPIFALHLATAVDNTGLLSELQTRDRTLAEVIEQQTATSEILRAISSSPTDLQPVLDAVVKRAAGLCQAIDASIVMRDGRSLRRVAGYGPLPVTPPEEDIPLTRELAMGAAVLDCKTIHIEDATSPEVAREYPESARMAARLGNRTVLLTPLVREGSALGAIVIRRTEVKAFSPRQIDLLKTFADQAVIAIENVRLFNELRERNKSLTEALEQQTATSEILRIISSSPTNLQPVLDAVAANAARLCGAEGAVIVRVVGDSLHIVAQHGSLPRPPLDQPFPIRRDFVAGRAVIDRQPVHVPELAAAPDSEFGGSKALLLPLGYRGAMLAVAMLREGIAIGAISAGRKEGRPFTDKQIALLQTFADQAVIAIENTRLFTELQERLEQQTATSEILRVISQSQRDVQPVFDTIASNARKLCRPGIAGEVFMFDGELLKYVAADSVSPEIVEAIRGTAHPLSRGNAAARAILTRDVVYIQDVLEDPEYRLQSLARRVGFRSTVSVPMLRDGSPIGVVAVLGGEPAMFTERQIAMLRTFADQAVIAIENTRLFNELEARNRDLTESLAQQTATSEILRVISGSPTNTQPVFDAILNSATKLCEADTGILFRLRRRRV